MIANDVKNILAPGVHHSDIGALVTSLNWIGDIVFVTAGDGSVRTIQPSGKAISLAVHHGAILCAARDPSGQTIITGGDDGRVCRVASDGSVCELGQFGDKWVDHLIASPASGILVAGVGREAVIWPKGATVPSHRFAFTSTIGGMALDAKGKRLAVSHYNGASLVYVNAPDSRPMHLEWIGSHLACAISGAGDFLITGLQETGLHCWQVSGAVDMQMSGYAAKTRSFSWNWRGKKLATSGAAGAVVWPFDGKTGPMHRTPAIAGQRRGCLVSRVAFHPRHDLLAAGYDDGGVQLLTFDGRDPLALDLLDSPIAALAWNDDGTCLAWGDEEGRVGTIDLTARP